MWLASPQSPLWISSSIQSRGAGLNVDNISTFITILLLLANANLPSSPRKRRRRSILLYESLNCIDACAAKQIGRMPRWRADANGLELNSAAARKQRNSHVFPDFIMALPRCYINKTESDLRDGGKAWTGQLSSSRTDLLWILLLTVLCIIAPLMGIL